MATDAQTPAATTNGPSVERRLVSVLFVDLVGFTELARTIDAEELRDLQGLYFARAREIVERYGGTVEKFIGDAVMAVWGAPTSNEDDAERAVRAALDITAAVRTLKAPAPMEARAGVATGHAAVSTGADGQGMVSGETVNLAARLQAAAPTGAVVTDEATRQAAAASVVYEDLGEQELKGFDRPVATWRADRVVSGRAGSGRTDELEAPFVGRSAEFDLLKDLFHATAREQRLRVVSITGQAGIGKTRLAWEFEKYIDGITEDVFWHQGRSPAYGEGITFWALGEMVRRRAGIAEGEDAASSADKLRTTLQQYVPDEAERATLEPALTTLLGIDERAPAERGLLFGAWRLLFERIADQGAVVLVFEDLQWADAGLVDFIGDLLTWSRQRPIFVITLARPELVERFPTWGAGQRNFTSLHLEPLPDADMRELLAGLVPGLPAPTVRAILRRAEGVPLYAVETVRMLVGEGMLVREVDAYRVNGTLEDLSVPATLHALVAARLDALAPPERHLLQEAAVLGTSFSVEGLSAVSGQTPDALKEPLDRLAVREILRLETDPSSPERGQYEFVQAVIREVAYETLSKRDRRTKHLAAARFFESKGDDGLAGALARHYLDAWRASSEGAEADALAAQARVALKGAAERASALHSNEQALAFLKLALEVATDDGERAELRERAAGAAQSAAMTGTAVQLIGEAIAWHESVGDEDGVARLTAQLGQLLMVEGRIDEAVDTLEPALARAIAGGADQAALVSIRNELARVLFNRSEYERAIALADEAIGSAERLRMYEPLVDAMITKGSAITMSRPLEGLAILYGAMALADRYDLPRPGLRARNNLGASLSGDSIAEWLALMRESEAIAERFGLRDEVYWARGSIASRFLDLGDTPAARVALDELLSDESAPEFLRWSAAGDDAIVAALEGDLPRLAARRAESIRLDRVVSQPVWRSFERGFQALASFLQGDLDRAVALADEAVEIDASSPVLFSYAGRFNALLGRVDVARRHLAAMDRLPDHGRLVDGWRATLIAAIAAAERDPETVARYRTALRLWREVQPILELSLTQLHFVLAVGLEETEVRTEAEDLRRTATAKGWQGVLARLEPLFAASGATPPARVETEVSGPAVPEAT